MEKRKGGKDDVMKVSWQLLHLLMVESLLLQSKVAKDKEGEACNVVNNNIVIVQDITDK